MQEDREFVLDSALRAERCGLGSFLGMGRSGKETCESMDFETRILFTRPIGYDCVQFSDLRALFLSFLAPCKI